MTWKTERSSAVAYVVLFVTRSQPHCHCSMCRKAHGAAFSANSIVPTEALTVSSGADLISEYESSPKRRKCFCSNCGSPLFIRRLDKPEVTVVTLGTLTVTHSGHAAASGRATTSRRLLVGFGF
jgi:hypothetical protein